MWRRYLPAFVLLGACLGPRIEQQRLADGSWQLTCRAPMDECVRELEKTCKEKRYRIIGGASELRLRDASPNETQYQTSHLGFVCTSSNEGALVNLSPDGTTGKICGAGDTRTCTGPGACVGGQTCRPDGTGFGPCDCGPAMASDAGKSAAPSSPMPPTSGSDAGTADAQTPAR